jgi:hypothetical protein
MIIFPGTFDRDTRGEFLRYAGETFQMCIKAGCTPQEARQFAIEYTVEKIKGFQHEYP